MLIENFRFLPSVKVNETMKLEKKYRKYLFITTMKNTQPLTAILHRLGAWQVIKHDIYRVLVTTAPNGQNIAALMKLPQLPDHGKPTRITAHNTFD